MADDNYEPVRVHLTGSDVQLGQPKAAGRRQRRITVFTRNIPAAGDVIDLLPFDPTRVCAWIQAGGSNVIVAASLAEIQDPANAVSGLPAPNGLVIPYQNAGPYYLEGTNRMWATAAAAAQVSVQVVHESDG